jgi:mannose-6-phosphate isomerase-like protein (cupin superfamily)
MGLFNATSLDTNLYFLHRGIIQPKSGIGAHFHNQCEEMFVIFDGEAQFTIDGRTSMLKGPAGAPVRMGHSHAIYNHTAKPVQWMNINVSARKGV